MFEKDLCGTRRECQCRIGPLASPGFCPLSLFSGTFCDTLLSRKMSYAVFSVFCLSNDLHKYGKLIVTAARALYDKHNNWCDPFVLAELAAAGYLLCISCCWSVQIIADIFVTRITVSQRLKEQIFAGKEQDKLLAACVRLHGAPFAKQLACRFGTIVNLHASWV